MCMQLGFDLILLLQINLQGRVQINLQIHLFIFEKYYTSKYKKSP